MKTELEQHVDEIKGNFFKSTAFKLRMIYGFSMMLFSANFRREAEEVEAEWTGQNETDDELFRIIKAMFLRFQEETGCTDLTGLRDDVLNEVHDHLVHGR